jgi:hypothetical protein
MSGGKNHPKNPGLIEFWRQTLSFSKKTVKKRFWVYWTALDQSQGRDSTHALIPPIPIDSLPAIPLEAAQGSSKT